MEPKHHVAGWYGEKHGWLSLYLGDDGDQAEQVWAERHLCGALQACRYRSGHLVGRWGAEAGAEARVPRRKRSRKPGEAEGPQEVLEPQEAVLVQEPAGAPDAEDGSAEDGAAEGGEQEE